MKPYLSSLLEKVPEDIRLNTQEFISEHIAVFEPKEYSIGQKVYFDHYHFVIPFSTPPLFKIGSREYQFHKKSLLTFKPGMDLTVLPFDSRVRENYISISVSKSFFQRIALEATDCEDIQFKKTESQYSIRLMDTIRNFKDEMIYNGNKCPVMIQSIGTQIVCQLLRDLNVDAEDRKIINRSAHKYIQKAQEYMQCNFNCSLSIAEISREIYISPAHFERLFKNNTGQTPHQYLIGIRIQKAKQMLEKDGYSIEDIARLCGFINLGHFSTVFRRALGISPSEYRRIIK